MTADDAAVSLAPLALGGAGGALADPWLHDIRTDLSTGMEAHDFDEEMINNGIGLELPGEPVVLSRSNLHFRDIKSKVVTLKASARRPNEKRSWRACATVRMMTACFTIRTGMGQRQRPAGFDIHVKV